MAKRWKVAGICLLVWLAFIALDKAVHADGFEAEFGLGVVVTPRGLKQVDYTADTDEDITDIQHHAVGIASVGYSVSHVSVKYFHVSSIETDKDPGLDVIALTIKF